MQLIGVSEDTVLPPGFDDEEVDGLLDLLCCDKFDATLAVRFLSSSLLLAFASSSCRIYKFMSEHTRN